jgi:glycerol-3-phosphate cytidylyltransferase
MRLTGSAASPSRQARDRPVVGYTAGVFDMFHVGHLNVFRHAREDCDFLIVGVTTDELAEARRGVRPVIPLIERMAVVQHVRHVDHVVPQSSMDKLAAWEVLKFDVLYVGDNLRGAEGWESVEQELAQVGVDVVYVPATHVRSGELLSRGLSHLVSE